MTLSVIEIYLERIKDLLNPGRDNLQVGTLPLLPPPLIDQRSPCWHAHALLHPQHYPRPFNLCHHLALSPFVIPPTRHRVPLQVIQDPARGIVVAEAREVVVANERDCVELMREGIANRAVSATAMNAGKGARLGRPQSQPPAACPPNVGRQFWRAIPAP